jgi:hypothetical protein
MWCSTQNRRISGLYPSSAIADKYKTQRFVNCICFRLQVRKEGLPNGVAVCFPTFPFLLRSQEIACSVAGKVIAAYGVSPHISVLEAFRTPHTVYLTSCMYIKKQSISRSCVCFRGGWGGGVKDSGTTMSKSKACRYRFCHVFCRHNVAACQGNYLTSRNRLPSKPHCLSHIHTQHKNLSCESFMNPTTSTCKSTQDSLLEQSHCSLKSLSARNISAALTFRPLPLTKLRGLSPRANYTDPATATCRRSYCHVVSVTDPYDCILVFLDRSRYPPPSRSSIARTRLCGPSSWPNISQKIW